MSYMVIYLGTVIIWGSTWLAIQFQIGEVPVEWSVSYRFISAGLILLLYCGLTKRTLQFSFKQHRMLIVQSVFMFVLNYWLFYVGSMYLTSGLIAILFAMLIFMNPITANIILKEPFKYTTTIGGLIGMSGLIIMLWGKVTQDNTYNIDDAAMLYGVIIILLATAFSSLGNVIAVYNQRYKLPIMQTAAFGMLYGGIMLAILAIVLGKPLRFEWSHSYIIALTYLSIFGSILGFMGYLQLLAKIGASRAAYVFISTPIVSLLLSTWFEGFTWTISVFIGIALILLGNLIVLRQ